VHRRLWQLLLAVSHGMPDRSRAEVLGWGAPLMIGGILVFWSTLYVVGFALVYLPSIRDVSAFSVAAARPSSDLGDALNVSATSFVTTGYGDIVRSTHSSGCWRSWGQCIGSTDRRRMHDR
jgi:hypothetical protein